MSVCRWSSDDHRSDLYVYPSAEGWTVSVAAARLDADWSKMPPLIEALSPGASKEQYRSWSEASIERITKVSEVVARASSVPIDHPAAGATFVFGDGAEAADFIDTLERDGFHVPDGVAEAVRGELITEGRRDV